MKATRSAHIAPLLTPSPDLAALRCLFLAIFFEGVACVLLGRTTLGYDIEAIPASHTSGTVYMKQSSTS